MTVALCPPRPKLLLMAALGVQRRAHDLGRTGALVSRLDHMERVVAAPVADDLAVHPRAPLRRVCSFLEHQHGRAFGDDEAVALRVEWSTRAFGLVVARRKCPH